MFIIIVQAYPDLVATKENMKNYIPKLFGFKIYKKRGSKYYKPINP